MNLLKWLWSVPEYLTGISEQLWNGTTKMKDRQRKQVVSIIIERVSYHSHPLALGKTPKTTLMRRASHMSLELEVSLDGIHFATGKFSPSMHPETHVNVLSFLSL
jgi:hypothetical protein